jgi:hypothetical protein
MPSLLAGGWTSQVSAITASVPLTSTTTRVSYTVTLPTNTNQIAVIFYYTPSGTAGANEWGQVEGVQLEAGSVATPFSRAGGTLQGELAACQRYYFKGGNSSAGVFSNTNTGRWSVFFPVEMRTAPTITAIAAPQVLNPTVAESQTGSQTTDFLATASGGLVSTKAASKIQFGGFSSAADGRASVLLNDCLQFSAEL